MPKKKVNPAEESEQTTGLMGQAGEEPPVPSGEPPQDTGALDGPLPISGDNPGPPEDGEGVAGEVMAVDVSTAPVPLDSGPEEAPPMEPPDIAPGDGQPLDAQEPGPDGDKPTGDDLPVGAAPAQAGDDTPPQELPDGDAPPAPPLTERQSFFALDFHELDRGLSQEERQAWNSIYASFRGHSALSGTVIGADPLSMNVRSKETGQVERRTMYCVVVLVYRVPIYIPATEMWMGEARPDYVLQNMMGSTIDFIITKVDREGGYAIASRRQAARAQRYFFAHRPDLCREGSRVKCRLLAVGPRRCLAECYGHDVDLTQRELSYTAIADLRTQYHPGDELDCIVKGYDAPRRELLISVKETETNPFEGAE